ncbi:hypothetical protein ENUP19_0364G0008 [Entamoeba nuttalli]|uniref:RBR-type E3 ubiquitin transferase n=2 Tax=Entamoeba nuttalli TaxID=412467 RepID=K2H9T8_ENTNP|nr:RING zinc finger protein, putative [Entamoeba nuttalli P19]EKE39359.1 RING zinc finger protein, putative [Entamoeba nuttalli P19]|eukprot:XP_008858302.1 RING zinc finger protein, putative [Entamoeba nuttalli P19]
MIVTMNEETKQIISKLPISSYRKKMLSQTECLEKTQSLKIILSEIQDNSQLFDVSEPIVLSLMYDFGFNKIKLQEKFFDDDNFLKKNGYIQKTKELFAPKEQCFPNDYLSLKFVHYCGYSFEEESILNLMGRNFNRVISIGALQLHNGIISNALEYLNKNLIGVVEHLRNDLSIFRGKILPPKTTLMKAPILSISPNFYYDLALRVLSENDIIEAINNPIQLPNDLKIWFNELEKTWKKLQIEREKKIEEEEKIETCEVCYEDKLPEEMIINRCGHSFCKECIIEYILTGMKENGKGIGNLKCLSSGCKCCITIDIVRVLVDDYTFYKYCELLISSFIERDKEIICKYCSNEKCGKLLHYKGEYFGGAVTAICSCQNNMCLLCGSINHRPASCTMWKKWQELIQKDGLNLKWIRKNSRPCPACKTFIEKNGGCQWMSCYKCHCFFCWVCMQITNDHQHKPGQTCTAYVPTEDKNEYINEETLSYITHYDLQNVGVKEAVKRNKTIIHIINNRKNIASTLAPLYEASLVEIDAHTILRNLFIYSYNKKEKKELIEFQQKKFQLQAELLTKRIQFLLKVEGITLQMMSDLVQFVKPIKESFNKIVLSIEEELEEE